MGILNYSTTVSAENTAAQVSKMLAMKGVSRTSTLYDGEGRACGIGFSMPTPHGVREYELAVNSAGVLAAMTADRSVRSSYCTPEQAHKTAWRIMKDWVEAQIAVVEAQLSTLDQIMLPHLVVAEGRTLYSVYREREQAALPAGGDS